MQIKGDHNQLFSKNESPQRLNEVKRYFLDQLKIQNEFTIKEQPKITGEGKSYFEITLKFPFDNCCLTVWLEDCSHPEHSYIAGEFTKKIFKYCEVVGDCGASHSIKESYSFLISNEDKLYKVVLVLNQIFEKIHNEKN